MNKSKFTYNFSQEFNHLIELVEPNISDFVETFNPLEANSLYINIDYRTNSIFCECHIKAENLIDNCTVDVPLDPEEQSEYRANRELDSSNPLYLRMIDDANNNRTFSNLVTEFSRSFDSDHPLKILGGQHRYSAILIAYNNGINQFHGVKVYFNLDLEQRMDVQLISNTNIDISPDLLDRVYETASGDNLRNWCQSVGLLSQGQDFADKRQQGPPISVRTARSFISNFYLGKEIPCEKFEDYKTIPILTSTGGKDQDWDKLKSDQPDLWDNPDLFRAGKEFSDLINAQYAYFESKKKISRKESSYPYVTYNYSIVSAWSYISGVLQSNTTRLERHYALKSTKSKDPLNAKALSEGKHFTDPENYRGIATRTGPKERGRLCELFYAQAENGNGISNKLVTFAIKSYHAKIANFEKKEAKEDL